MNYSLIEDIESDAMNRLFTDILEEANQFGEGLIRNVASKPYYKDIALEFGSEDFLLDVSKVTIEVHTSTATAYRMNLISHLNFDGVDIKYQINPTVLADTQQIKNLFLK